MITSPTETIRQFNDAFRTTLQTGRVVMTRGVQTLGPANLNVMITIV